MSSPAPTCEDLERMADLVGVPMPVALAHAGIAYTTWWRWRAKRVEPRASTLRKLQLVLAELSVASLKPEAA